MEKMIGISRKGSDIMRKLINFGFGRIIYVAFSKNIYNTLQIRFTIVIRVIITKVMIALLHVT